MDDDDFDPSDDDLTPARRRGAAFRLPAAGGDPWDRPVPTSDPRGRPRLRRVAFWLAAAYLAVLWACSRLSPP